MRRHHNKLLSRVTQTAVVLALVSASSVADVFQFISKRDWETWTFPPGELVTTNDGSLTLSRVDKAINAVRNSTDFLHKVKRTRDLIPGGIRGFSNESTVKNLVVAVSEMAEGVVPAEASAGTTGILISSYVVMYF